MSTRAAWLVTLALLSAGPAEGDCFPPGAREAGGTAG